MEGKELVIIFKARNVKEQIRLEPISCVIGHFDEDDDVFIDEKGYTYSHFSKFMPGRCFGVRQNLKELMSKFSIFSEKQMKEKYLSLFKEGYYYVGLKEHKIHLLYKNTEDSTNYKICKDIDAMEGPEIYTIQDLETEEEKSLKSNNTINIDTKQLRESIKKCVLSQDEAIDKIVTTIWKNIKNKNKPSADNILVSGSTGVGKTEIFRNIAKQIGIPIIKCDANDYTSAGYVGKNIEEMLQSLISNANGDLVKASHGIIIVDEIDKLAGTGKNDEVGTTKVQDALLTMIEGKTYKIRYGNDVYNMDTSNITFVGLGAFARAERFKPKTVGFNTSENSNPSQLTDEEIINYGLEPELLGRFPVRVILNDLKIEDLYHIAKDAESSSLKQELDFLRDLGIVVDFTDDLILNIAKKAYSYKSGARGISRVVSDMLEEVMKEISDGQGEYNYLELQSEIVNDKKRYVLRK